MKSPRVDLTIAGLGLGRSDELGASTHRALQNASEIWIEDLSLLPADFAYRNKTRSTDGLKADWKGCAGELAQKLVDRTVAGPVAYLLPGDPTIDNIQTVDLLEVGSKAAVSVEILPAASLLDQIIRLTTLSDRNVQVISAQAILERGILHRSADPWPRLLATPLLQVTVPSVIHALPVVGNCSDLRDVLLDYYPSHQTVEVIFPYKNGTDPRRFQHRLSDLSRFPEGHGPGFLYLPPLGNVEDLRSFYALRHIVARLRAPGGCPWDREQTHQSLKPYLTEECFEVLEALDSEDMTELEEELGDLLLQIVLHAELAAERGDFAMHNVFEHISAKLIRRHPHVFENRTVADSNEVVRNWEQIKREEKGDAPEKPPSLLGGVPKEMPALAHASSIQRRVEDVGFAWPDLDAALAKVAEEAEELRVASDPIGRRAEFGDLLFALVSSGRKMGLDAEESLRLANQRFMRRFNWLESLARDRSLNLKNLSPIQLESLWNEAKTQE